jgi:hypothetical protein
MSLPSPYAPFPPPAIRHRLHGSTTSSLVPIYVEYVRRRGQLPDTVEYHLELPHDDLTLHMDFSPSKHTRDY